MTTASPNVLNDDLLVRADAAVEAASAFCERETYPLGVAMIRHLWRDGSANAVLDALATYQNSDGGIGNGLEVDIVAPVSNAFATRLAMQTILALRDQPQRDHPVVAGIHCWLVESQDADGDWHFAPDVYQHELAPWFAGWSFPSLNPACCVAGLASRLEVGTLEMFSRVAALFAEQSDIEMARTGEFYDVLPYVEYAPRYFLETRDAWLDAIAKGITTRIERQSYDDASHALDHALGGGRELSRRIPHHSLKTQATCLLDEQEEDGGWPSPYSPAWRPQITANAFMALAKLRDDV